jgi:hypothetical protein
MFNFKPKEIVNPMTADQKMQVLQGLLISLNDWRKMGNIQEPCFPPSFLNGLAILFPDGM